MPHYGTGTYGGGTYAFPVATPTTTKREARNELVRKIQQRVHGTTTGAGSATTFVDSGLAGYGDDYFKDWFVLITSGTHENKWRQVTAYTSSTGTFTFQPTLGSASGSGVRYELHKLCPEWYTTALREACLKAYPAAHRAVTAILVPDNDHDTYAFPSHIHDLWRVRQDDRATEKVDDAFDRADSSSTAGTDWTAVAGTWGISSERLYSVTDANANLIVQASDPEMNDGMVQALVRGTLNSGTDYRALGLVFRYIDASNFMVAMLVNSLVQLWKVDGGTTTALTTAAFNTADATDYHLSCVFIGEQVRVFVNGVEYINHVIGGSQAKYLEGTNVGVYLYKGGSPATAARLDNFRAHLVRGFYDRNDWRQERGVVEFGVQSHREALRDDRLIWLEGAAPLTQPAEDTTFGTISSDTTEVLEIDTDDPAWPLFLLFAEGELYKVAAQPGNAPDPNDRAVYAERAAAAFGEAEAQKAKFSQARPKPSLRHPRY